MVGRDNVDDEGGVAAAAAAAADGENVDFLDERLNFLRVPLRLPLLTGPSPFSCIWGREAG